VEEGRMRSIIGTVRFVSRGDLFRNRRLERASFVFPSLYLSPGLKPERWRAEATYEVSRPGLGSDFEFSRFIGRVRLHYPLSARFTFDAVAYLGFTTGSPPLPKRFFLGGLGTLRGFERKQFTGENMSLAIAEWSWFPPSRFAPALIPFYDGASLWGGDFPSTGWKHDGGIGLRWPQASRVFARVDAAVPFNPEPGQARKVQWNLRVQIPF
jgi:hemolysin activation/secretion protein